MMNLEDVYAFVSKSGANDSTRFRYDGISFEIQHRSPESDCDTAAFPVQESQGRQYTILVKPSLSEECRLKAVSSEVVKALIIRDGSS